MDNVVSFPSRPGVIAAASICVFRGPRVLLVRRAKPPFLWSLPGGRVEPGETAEQAAMRELHEETGVRAAIVAAGSTIEFQTANGEHYVISNFAARYLSGHSPRHERCRRGGVGEHRRAGPISADAAGAGSHRRARALVRADGGGGNGKDGDGGDGDGTGNGGGAA